MKKENHRDRKKDGFFKESRLKKVGRTENLSKSKRYFGFDDEDE